MGRLLRWLRKLTVTALRQSNHRQRADFYRRPQPVVGASLDRKGWRIP